MLVNIWIIAVMKQMSEDREVFLRLEEKCHRHILCGKILTLKLVMKESVRSKTYLMAKERKPVTFAELFRLAVNNVVFARIIINIH